MYIFARSRAINPANGRAAHAVAVEAGVRASDLSGIPIFVWSTIFSANGPAVFWSARLDHLADALAADDTIFGDEGFAQWAEDNDALFLGSPSDVISQVVHGAPTGPPKSYVQLTQAVLANGSGSEGMGFAIEFAETATRITGVDAMVVTPVTGPYGAVGWISTVDDLAEVEAANAALAASDEWLKLVDRGGHAFAPGATTSMARRIG